MKLNKEQKLAINSKNTDIVVLACAGSGKTTVLTQRICRLLDEGISPKEICAVTFTRKAADELRQRIDRGWKWGTQSIYDLRIGTFHSLCLEMIEAYPVTAGYGLGSKLVVYDEEDKKSIMEGIKAKLGSKPPEELIQKEYLSILARHSAIDYDIMVDKALFVLCNNESARNYYHNKFRFLFVDEFQDTDTHQIHWIKLLYPEYLFVVGDDDQNIYGWRGTDVRAFREYQREAPREKIILPRNYRSMPLIIDTANEVISKELGRIKKTMVPAKKKESRDAVWLFEHDNPMAEGNKIEEIIGALSEIGLLPLSEIAILGRTNKQLDGLCDYLSASGFPVERVGRKNDLWKKPGWRLGANILRLLYSPWDAHVYKSILRELGEPIGPTLDADIVRHTIKGIELWKCYDGSLKAAFNDIIGVFSTNFLEEPAADALELFIALSNVIRNYTLRNLSNRQVQLEKLLEWLQKKEWSIKKFVHWFNFREVQDELDEPDVKNKVKLMTVHVAKGLEFEAVIIPFCNSDTWPNRRSDPDEERRLFYVAITRAKSYLYFTRAAEDIRGKPTTISPLIDWIKDAKLDG